MPANRYPCPPVAIDVRAGACPSQPQKAVLLHGYENFYYYDVMLDEMLDICDVCGLQPPVSSEEFWALPSAERRRVLVTFFLDVGCQYAAHWKRCVLRALA